MNKKNKVFAGVMLGFFSTACMAQGEDPAQAYVYSTYHVCDLATQEQMDGVIEQYDKPVLDKAVEDGRMNAWGYYAHMTGGPWRRLQYHIAPTMEAVLENQQTVFAEIYQDNPAAGQARSAACARHDDYIWALLDGSGDGGDGDPPAVSLSVYYVCDYTREEQADEMVAETFAPVLNQLVEDDKLAGWSWLAHRVGGKYRRLHTMTGASHAAVLAARAEVLQATGGQAGGGFGDICGSHTDYLWDIVH